MPDSASSSLQIGPADIARLTGIDEAAARAAMQKAGPLSYHRLTAAERDAVILRALEQLERSDLVTVGGNDASRWERGWGEILERVRSRGVALQNLLPQYFHYDILRYDGDWIRIDAPDFEFRVYDIFRRALFPRHLVGYDRLVDIGCGTAASLLTLSDLFPEAELVGCDWAAPSQELVRLIGQHLRRPLRGVRFNMLTLAGGDALEIDARTAVLTMHSMEQLGTAWGPMLDFLLARKPGLCLHIEPIRELYDPTDLFDALALRYHDKRNYLSGYLTALRAKAAEGLIEIRETRRLCFGSAFHEGYSLVVWAPR
ncbi:class I SAM-dependent methyltransferase [Desertibaculum subflavum]|uniref:class I SAM-dependent methyltransferase n=1 Tax=Desertibaculum subflavum TaxID=2268458 RepID=UPI000E674E85